MISRSPHKGSFSNNIYKKKLEANPDDEAAKSMLDWYHTFNKEKLLREESEEWRQDNLEYDLRSTEWILEKVRSNKNYAQNLYAALCNNDFQKLDVMPILSGKTWSCSWRYAGGILADMRESGDYMDYYCSGIHKDMSDEEYNNLTKDQQEEYLNMKNNHVGEGEVTEEIKEDLLRLGWQVITVEED